MPRDLVDGLAVAERLAAVRERIARAGADPQAVGIVAVTKSLGVAAIEAAVRAGLYDIGENYAQELLGKVAGAPPGVRWHFLGAPQRNKISRLAPHVHIWQGIDNEQAALALAKRCPGASVLVQVRLYGAPPRRGAPLPEVPALVEVAAKAGLDVRGLMAVGPPEASPSELRASFRQVARLAGHLGLRELSMGMSGDFEQAVAEGATMLRLGRVLFGER
ncbi:MAG: YggS family pyridoxal phosphate-dependent enzyme [Acidimicrobiales bacterium]